MKVLKRFVLMLQFFTRIPIRIRLYAKNEDYGKGLMFAPLIGLVIGAILAFSAYLLLLIFSKTVVSALVLVLYIMLTGGLHLDGLGDTFDGIFSNRPKDRILEIMRDSRVGTNAVLAVSSVLIINFAALAQIKNSYYLCIILLMPVAGRIASLVGAAVSTYARSGEGLGKSFIDCCGKNELVLGLVLYAAIGMMTFDYRIWGVLLLPPVSAFFLVKGLSRKIGGATGDILGAVCEMNQSIFLLLCCAVFAN